MNRSKFFSESFKNVVWGYWVGGFFCLFGIFSLSMGFAPLITAAREKMKIVELPGRSEVNFKIPGTYVAVSLSQGLEPETVQRIKELEYFMTDEKETEMIEIDKIPARAYVSEKEEKQLPLFQFVIENKGKYVLVSNYPYEMEGPKVQVALFHTDMNYVRAEIIVGSILFLAFGILGFFIVRKAYKSKKLPFPSANS